MKTHKLFGTDGIRGQANAWPLIPDVITHLAMSAAKNFMRGDHRHTVVIGKDTRQSCYMIENALTAGFTSAGFNVILLGPIPTPAVALLTKSLRADLGVVISASHNLYHDNGIKFFGPTGYKLSDKIERNMEKGINGPFDYASIDTIGKAKRLDDATGRYIEFAKSSFPKNLRLDGLKIVVDCANGAAYKVAPAALWELGAEVITVANMPDGQNINHRCGATCPDFAQRLVLEHNADLAVILDGDADRLIIVDEKGTIIDGDQILALIAAYYHKNNLLKGQGIVATQMSNLGLERFMASQDLTLFRSDVGDRYVIEKMLAKQCNLGGEQSGHLILHDYATTGDGLIAALQVLSIVQMCGKPVSEIAHVFEAVPQVLKNLKLPRKININDAQYQKRIDQAKGDLGHDGYLIVRSSGTEPLIRFMAQGDNHGLLDNVLDGLMSDFQSLIEGE